jgi:cytidylate kinase
VADAPPVRDVMKQVQRRMAEGIDVVTEGRDQGSVVFPHAELKVFLTASPLERARRRHEEEVGRGQSATLEAVLAAQTRRDEADCNRPVGAMKPAADAVLLETDGLSPDEVLDRLVSLIDERRKGTG